MGRHTAADSLINASSVDEPGDRGMAPAGLRNAPAKRMGCTVASLIACIALIPNAYVIESASPILELITPALYVVMYGLGAVALARERKLPSRPLVFSGVWVLISLASLLFVPNQPAGLLALAKLIIVGFGLTFVTTLVITSRRRFDYLIRCFLGASCTIQVIVLAQFAAEGMPLGRFHFYDVHPIPLGALGSMSAAVLIAKAVNQELRALPFICLMAPAVFTLVISSSKGPTIALVVAIVFMLPWIFARLSRTVVFVTSIAATYLVLIQFSQFQLMIHRWEFLDDDDSTYDRVVQYQQALEVFWKRPILGAGSAAFEIYPHNVLLQLLGEGGVLLCSLAIVYIAWLFLGYTFALRNGLPDGRYLAAFGVTVSSVTILMVSYTYVDLKFLYLGTGLLLALKALETKNAADTTYIAADIEVFRPPAVRQPSRGRHAR